MSAKLEIAAGIAVWKNSSVMAAVYERVAERMHQTKAQRWLLDVAKRPAPFLDISLRGLPPESRVDFAGAVQQALIDEFRPAVKAALSEIDEAIRRAESEDVKFATQPISGIPEDLDQVWSV